MRPAITRCTILAAMGLFTLDGFAQKSLFLGFHEQREANKNYWCFDRTYESAEIDSRKVYDSLRQEFLLKHKGLNPFTVQIKPEESVVVYEFTRKVEGFGCNAKTIGYVVGKSMLEAQYEFGLLKKTPASITPYEIVFTWRGERQIETLVELYDDVSIKYTTGMTASGKVPVVIKASNKSKDRTALLVIKPRGANAALQIEVIQPSQTLTRSVNTSEGFDVQVGFIETGARVEPTNSIIQSVKEWVGQRIELNQGKMRNGQMERSSTCMCIRG